MDKNNNKIKIVFVGTAEFGLPAFQLLQEDQNSEIILVITQPDKLAGRHRTIVSPPIKRAALEHDLTVLQPEQIIDIKDKIALLKPDLIITIAYAQLIPEVILNIPKFGCLNLHASLLPKYRGAGIIQAAILNGDQQTGLSIIKMDKGLDTGPILAQIPVEIEPNDTAGTLYERLSKLSADFLLKTVKQYLDGKLTPRPQEANQASYIKELTKGDGLIDWTKTAEELSRFTRAMSPWPMAWTWWQGKKIKIIAVQPEPIEINSYKPGKTFKYNSGLAVQCGKNSLIIKKLQLEGKTELKSEDFLRGQKDFIGSLLG